MRNSPKSVGRRASATRSTVLVFVGLRELLGSSALRTPRLELKEDLRSVTRVIVDVVCCRFVDILTPFNSRQVFDEQHFVVPLVINQLIYELAGNQNAEASTPQTLGLTH